VTVQREKVHHLATDQEEKVLSVTVQKEKAHHLAIDQEEKVLSVTVQKEKAHHLVIDREEKVLSVTVQKEKAHHLAIDQEVDLTETNLLREKAENVRQAMVNSNQEGRLQEKVVLASVAENQAVVLAESNSKRNMKFSETSFWTSFFCCHSERQRRIQVFRLSFLRMQESTVFRLFHSKFKIHNLKFVIPYLFIILFKFQCIIYENSIFIFICINSTYFCTFFSRNPKW
jgi:hypothetical protein